MDLDETWKVFCSKLQKIKPTDNGIEALCPAHDDKRASLTASFTKDKILFKCQASCSFDEVVNALGMEPNDFFAPELPAPPKKKVATYKYKDKEGNHVFSVVRFEPKDFRPQRPDGKYTLEGVERVPYRLPEMLKAIEEERTVLLVEGEKDCDNLAKLGLIATTFPGGAGKWRPEYLQYFKGASVCCMPDNDKAGREGTELLAYKLLPATSRILWLELPDVPERGDITDWLKIKGNDAEKFREMVQSHAVVWEKVLLPKKPEVQMLHKDFFYPKGFVGDLTKFIVDNSKYHQPILALSASLAYAGVLMGRKVTTEENTRSNLFIAALAPTGHGKESARHIIKKLDADLKLECFGAEKVTSRAAIERVLAHRESSLFMIDEFGLYMKAIFSNNASSHQLEIMSTFMEVFTSSGGSYFGQDKASVSEQQRFELQQPCCSIYGTSTPSTFWQSLNSGKVRDGSLNRFLCFSTPLIRPARQRAKIIGKFPKNIVDRCQYFKNMSIQPHKVKGDMSENMAIPEPEVIVYSDPAWNLFEKLEDYSNDKIDSSGVTGSMWVRAAEMAKKVALINCVSDNKSEISADHAEYACELVKFLNKNTCTEIFLHLADNDSERTSKRVERLIIDSSTKGLSTTDLYRSTRFLRNSKHRREILEDLTEAGLIVCLKDDSYGSGRKSERWFASEAI